MRNAATAAALANCAFVAGCVQSRDDSAENAFDASGLVFRSGLVGSVLPNLGTESTPTGIRQKFSTTAPPPPLVANNFNTVANAIGYTAALQKSLSQDQRNKVAKLASRLTGTQARRLASINSVAHVKTLVECAGVRNVELVESGSSAIDPLNSSQGTAIRTSTISEQTQMRAAKRVFFSTLVYNGLIGNAGSVNLEMGGFDYHNGSRTAGDAKDRDAGATVGRIIEMAHLLQKPVFIYVTSDGSVVSTDSESPGSAWVSDRGNAGMVYIIMYHPNGRPATSGPQIGHYNSGQEAEEATAIGSSPEVAAQAVFANYCRFAYGKQWESNYRRVLPRGGSLEGAVLESVLKVVA